MGLRVPPEIIDDIVSRVSIVEIVSRHVRLKKVGRNYVGLCPFHQEKTPSFTVNEEKGLFYCFGCSQGGTVITFLMKIENLNFTEALEQLAPLAGVDISQYERRISREEIEKRAQLYEVCERACHIYEDNLWSSTGTPAQEYLRQRGVSPDTARAFRLGYAPATGNFLTNRLLEMGYSEDLIREAGLGTSTSPPRDFFRNRLIFPIMEKRGRVVGFGGRSLDGSEPKYLNGGETPIFRKRSMLYGIHTASGHIASTGYVILVEGYMDVISLYQAGVKNTVATLGTALTDFHVRTLKKHARDIRLMYDGDLSGVRAALRSLDVFIRNDITPFFIPLPPGSDPDDIVREKGAEELYRLVEGSRPLVEVYIEKEAEAAQESVVAKKEAVRRVAGVLKAVRDPVEREEYLTRASQIFNLSKEIFEETWSLTQEKAHLSQAEKHGVSEEQVIIHAALEDKEFLEALAHEKLIEQVEHHETKQILKKLMEEYPGKKVASFIENLESESQKKWLSQIVREPPEDVDIELFKKEMIIKLNIKKIENALKNAKDLKMVQDLSRKKNDLINRLKQLDRIKKINEN